MTNLTNEMLADWAEAALAAGAKYWYGTCWYRASEDLLRRKKEQYPSHYGSGRMAVYRSHIAERLMVCDCVGLIKGFFWTANGTAESRYRSNNCPDTSANGMIALCDETWQIADMPDERGLLVWFGGHIGVYVGGGYVIEARGYRYGVVRTKLSQRPWKKAGRLPEHMLVYGADAAGLPTIRRGHSGDIVKHLQTMLMRWNAAALPKYGADGDFGRETDAWVREFQRAHGLCADGIADGSTWDRLAAVADEPDGAAPVQKPTLREGDSGQYVRVLQRLLIEWDDAALPKYGADGDFGSETDVWVRSFQRARGLEIDGIVGKNTWAALEET